MRFMRWFVQMKREVVLVFAVLALAANACAGHDAITESMVGLLPERWQAFLKDRGHWAAFRHDNHFPDTGKFSQLPDEDVAFFRAHGMTAVYPFHHGFPRAMAADRLVRAIRAGNDELALRYVGLLAHSLWDQKSLGHDTLFQYVNYMMTRNGGPGVVPDFPVYLSARIAGTKSFKAAVAGYREQPLPADYTPMDMFAEVTGWKWTAMDGYARGEEFLRGFMLDVTDPKNPEGIEIVGREYGAYAVWALERLLLVVRAAQKFAAEGYCYPAFDAKAVSEMMRRQDLEYGRRHDARVDVYAAPCFRKPGEEMKVAILYDPLEQWAAGFFDRISRVLNVQIAGSIREKRPDLKAALLDIRDFANEGLDPAKTPILVMGGRRTDRGYPACPWAKMLKSFNDYAARGGKIVWIDGLPPPSLDCGKIIPCHLEAKEKDHYANPAFVVSKENVPRSDMAWTGKDPEAWRFRRWCGSTQKQGWIWAGSRIYWDPKNLPAGSRAVLEYRTPAEFEPDMPVKVVGLVTPAERPVFAYLPTNALFPYYLTDERPVLLPAPKWRLDSAGEKILFGILDLLNGKN